MDSRLFIGELVIFILALIGGGVSFRASPTTWYWAPNFFIAVIALMMMLKVFFV